MKAEWLSRSLIAGPYYTLCLTEESFRAALAHIEYREPLAFMPSSRAHATTHHLVSQSNERCCIVCMRDWRGRAPIEVAGLLVHEAVHIFQEWTEQVGEVAVGKETQAYSIQWIAQELMQEFVRQTGGTHGK